MKSGDHPVTVATPAQDFVARAVVLKLKFDVLFLTGSSKMLFTARRLAHTKT